MIKYKSSMKNHYFTKPQNIFIVFLFLTLGLSGCVTKEKNRFIITEVQFSLVSFDVCNDTISIRSYTALDTNVAIKFDFKVDYVSDDSKEINSPNMKSQGTDGPLDTINHLNIYLNKTDITNHLSNTLDKDECRFTSYPETGKRICSKTYKYGSLTNSLPCFKDINDLIESYNNEAPFLWERGLTCFLEINHKIIVKNLSKNKSSSLNISFLTTEKKFQSSKKIN